MKDPWPDGHYAEEDLYSKMQGFARRGWFTAFVCKLMRNIPWLSVIWILRHACKTHISYITTSESYQQTVCCRYLGGHLAASLGESEYWGCFSSGSMPSPPDSSSKEVPMTVMAASLHFAMPNWAVVLGYWATGIDLERHVPVSTSSRNRCSMLAVSLMNLMVCDMW